VSDTRDDRPLVLRAFDEGVLTLTLNRGERFNPLSSAMIAALDATVAHFTGLIQARSAATIRLGKAAFYAQIEQPIAGAYAATSEVMACNMLLDDASEGIDAFLGKRAPAWQGR